MRAYSAMLFFLCINVAAWILTVSGVYPTGGQFWVSPDDVILEFGLSVFGSIVGSIIGTGLVNRLLNLQLSGDVLVVVWLAEMLILVAGWFFGGLPIVLARILGSELWFINVTIQSLFGVMFFIFIVEVVGRRQIT